MNHKAFGYSEGLILLGRIDGGAEKLKVLGSLKVTTEVLKEAS
jgi:hypothetical protein